MRKIALLSAIVLFSILYIACSDDNKTPISPNQNNSGDTAITISGITVTAIHQEIISTDADDWCFSSLKDLAAPPPSEYALYPAYPNPTYQQVLIEYELPAAGDVDLAVIDSTSTVVRHLVDLPQNAGRYQVSWDRRDTFGDPVAPGLYRVRMRAGSFECHGDVEIQALNNGGAPPIYFIVTRKDTMVVVTYQSSTEVGGVQLIFTIDGTPGTTIFGAATQGMSNDARVNENGLYVSVLPNPWVLAMPAGRYRLCTIPMATGSISLDYADAADTIYPLETIIVDSL
jgi:hypothetical protein